MPLRCRQNTVRPFEQPMQQRTIESQQGLLLNDIAVPCQYHSSPVTGEQARQIRQWKRHMYHNHIRLLCHLSKLQRNESESGQEK